MCGLMSLGVGVVAYLLGLGAGIGIVVALVAGASGALIVSYETMLASVAGDLEQDTDRSEQVIRRRRAGDWWSSRDWLRQRRRTMA